MPLHFRLTKCQFLGDFNTFLTVILSVFCFLGPLELKSTRKKYQKNSNEIYQKQDITAMKNRETIGALREKYILQTIDFQYLREILKLF